MQLQNKSLFTPASFIILRDAELVKGKDAELLASWIKTAASVSDTLILISDENSIDKKIEGAVPSSHKKIFWEMFENRKLPWVQSFFRKNGFSVTEEAAEQILDMIENNTESLKSECSRFFYCFEKGHTVTATDVDKILAHNREETAFTLFEAMADPSKSPKSRFENAVEILQKIRVSRSGNAVALIAGLTYCFRQLRLWHQLHSNGASPTDAQLRAAGFSGKKNQGRYMGAAKVWGAGNVSSILALLAHTDISNRESGTLLESTSLTLMLYSIVVKNGIFCEEYQP